MTFARDSLDREYENIRNGAEAFRVDRDVIGARGEEAASFLHGQLSQDIEGLQPGDSTWSFVLQPHGKVDALVRVTRVAGDEFILDCDAGFGALVRERLERFKLRTRIAIERLEWQMISVRGQAAPALDAGDGVAVPAHWPNIGGMDVLAPKPDAPEDLTGGSPEMYDVLRIESGIPQMGREMDEKTIPAEVGMNDVAISMTKGCYTGQELVARIDSRGNNVPRRLRTIVMESEETPSPGARLITDGHGANPKLMGVLSSVGYSPRRKAIVGLAMVRREISPGSEIFVDIDERPFSARVEEAPLTQ